MRIHRYTLCWLVCSYIGWLVGAVLGCCLSVWLADWLIRWWVDWYITFIKVSTHPQLGIGQLLCHAFRFGFHSSCLGYFCGFHWVISSGLSQVQGWDLSVQRRAAHARAILVGMSWGVDKQSRNIYSNNNLACKSINMITNLAPTKEIKKQITLFINDSTHPQLGISQLLCHSNNNLNIRIRPY